jgi:ribosomal protein S14
MTAPEASDAVAALRDFMERIDALDPTAPRVGGIEIRVGDDEARYTLRLPVARALAVALRAYHDPRDRGRCHHCGGRRLDDNFLCVDCGRPNGLFGQLILERAARFGDSTAPLVEDWD